MGTSICQFLDDTCHVLTLDLAYRLEEEEELVCPQGTDVDLKTLPSK